MTAVSVAARCSLLLAALWLAATGSAQPPQPGAAEPQLLLRLEAQALLETLNAELLSHDSATATLERWCSAYRLAPTPQIVAVRAAGATSPASEELRHDLQVAPRDELRYRRVSLKCGERVLSEAENWYVPARLTPAMNTLLETTQTPFGRVVQPLHFLRHTLAAEALWMPLPPDWALQPTLTAGTGAPLCVPPLLLRHRALLTLPDGTPISEVVETCTASVLAVPALAALKPC
jgi:chorismate-pyruvate lyase